GDRHGLGTRTDHQKSVHWFSHFPDSPMASRLVVRSEEHTSELQSRENLVCRLLLEKKNTEKRSTNTEGNTPDRPSYSPAATYARHPTDASSRDSRPRHHVPHPLHSSFAVSGPTTSETSTLSLHDALPISATAMALGPAPTTRSLSTGSPTFPTARWRRASLYAVAPVARDSPNHPSSHRLTLHEDGSRNLRLRSEIGRQHGRTAREQREYLSQQPRSEE